MHEFVKNAVGVVLMSARCAAEAVGGGRANQTVLFRDDADRPPELPQRERAARPRGRARERFLGGFDAEAQEVRQWHWPLFEAYDAVGAPRGRQLLGCGRYWAAAGSACSTSRRSRTRGPTCTTCRT